jgi:succinate dehydrogenase hydrophobic anchor subunit
MLMIDTPSVPKPGEGVWLWFIKILTGVLIIVLLGVHFVVNHFIAQNGLLTWADVVAYYRNPIVPIMEGLFLALVVSHSLIGLRGIILDLNPSKGVITFVNWLFSIVGVGALVWGLYLISSIVASGAG